jgi:hypothetical protein
MPIKNEDPFGGIKSPVKDATPAATEVNRLHDKSDVDSSSTAQHHTLGIKHDQAAPGDHKHDGRNSKRLLENIVFPADSTTSDWRDEVELALKQLGAI